MGVLATARAKNLRNNDLASARATQRRMETEEAVQATQGINDGLLARHEVASELRQARVARQQDESTKAAAAAWQMTSGARSREAASRQTGNLEAFREVESETRALKEYQDQTRLRLEEKLREAVCKERLQGWTNFCNTSALIYKQDVELAASKQQVMDKLASQRAAAEGAEQRRVEHAAERAKLHLQKQFLDEQIEGRGSGPRKPPHPVRPASSAR